MGFYIKTVTTNFAECDWCGKTVETTAHRTQDWFRNGNEEPDLPEGWERDRNANKDHPPIFCNEVHMLRARKVAELKKLP